MQTKLFNFFSIILTLIIIATVTYGYMQGYFTSIEDLQLMVSVAGMYGPVVFMLVQIIQVILPIIPGGVSNFAGVMLFGPILGFIYNYVRVVIKSFVVRKSDMNLPKAVKNKFIESH